ncbi:MAG TPA: ABC-type transport auxiliary lipoprotein family protein [Burkholderiaceae bacterium]|nr:ABC-type transport auxiliary lipoprotein family protein [Burkholderiaceae bacterium]
MNFLLKLAPLATAALLAACASPSPAPVLLTLPPVLMSTPGSAMPAAPAAAPLLAVRRVTIPEYLVARRVRFRADAATLAEWPNTYWAERIEIGVSREFVSALRQQLPGWAICETTCGDHVPALTLQLDLVPMDFVRGAQQLQAHAHLTLGDGAAAARVLRVEERSYTLAATADTAQGHAQAIAALIQKVAADAAPMIRDARR